MTRWPDPRTDPDRGKPLGPPPVRPSRRPDRSKDSRRDRQRDRDAPRIPWEERKTRALEDLTVYRSISFQDLCETHFGGNQFTARRAVSQLQAAGLVQRTEGRGPRGNAFLVLTPTRRGVQQAKRHPRAPASQRRWHGMVKPREAHHDTAIYRAALRRIAKLEEQGYRIVRVRLDAELKSELAKAAETARARGGAKAARIAQHARARELKLPVAKGQVHIPDVQIEYERPDGSRAIASVEVVTGAYREGAIRAKAAAGFHLAASGEAGARRIRAALGGRPMQLGDSEGRGGDREIEEWDF